MPNRRHSASLALLRMRSRHARAKAPTNAGWPERFNACLTQLRGIVLTFITFLTVAGAVAALGWEISQNRIQIEPIGVPNSLADQGYSGKVVADRLVQHLEHIRQNAKTTMRRTQLETNWAQGADIIVPGTGLSLRSTAAFLRNLVGLPTTVISGDIVYSQPAAEGKPQELVMRLMMRTSEARTIKTTFSQTNVDDLMFAGAMDLIKWMEPYMLASYYYEADRKKADAVIKHIFKEFSGTRHAIRAQNLVGIMHLDDGIAHKDKGAEVGNG